MSDEPQSAAIRKSYQISPALCLGLGGCLLGVAIALAGHFLADRQEADLRKNIFISEQKQQQLIVALHDATLNAPRLHLEELANLPLFAEYIDLFHDDPAGRDAVELKNYLQTVLEAAVADTGLGEILLTSQDGVILIAARNLTLGADDMLSTQVAAVVKELNGSENVAGQLIGALSESELTLLPALADGSDTTASVSSETNDTYSYLSHIASSTRFLALAAGLATALLALTGTALLRRSRR
ncbi:hypothetical protein [uncultured Roseibium sp.]|uniref:hypothetical protein n=1 Tax=uncultured Roseibium sp. TaxID=1936171 RepID=UPI002605B147|nr:hypothetical protein [uncultured Roseibium sp.]MCR9285268.1 hypothetical protein [Paracoccaceae bacterium]